MFNKTLFLLLSTMVFMSSKITAQTLWKIEKVKNGIKVYTKPEKGSDFKSFKAVMLVAASTSERLCCNAKKRT